MKLADCFTFYNELDMLELRLAELHDIVTYFVLVEATKTHTGNDKPLYFQENKPRFEKYLDKIIHVVVDDFPETHDPWVREHFQRNAIDRGIVQIMDEIDTVTICDLDEIPDSDTLTSVTVDRSYALEMDLYYYNFQCKHTKPWHLAKVLPLSEYLQIRKPEKIRHSAVPIMKRGGWHLSYFGDEHFIKNKIQNFAHQEYNSEEYTDLNIIKNRMNTATDVYGRAEVEFERAPNSTYLPRNAFLI